LIRFNEEIKGASYEYGDILDWADEVDFIGHQVNCFGVMGGGLALQIARKWPSVLSSYQKFIDNFIGNQDRKGLLGKCFICSTSTKCKIANLFGQYDTGGRISTNYEALLASLTLLRKTMISMGKLKLALPVNLGCGLAGGNWNTVHTIIKKVFENTKIQLTLVEYKPK
jgi:O-acetyl-ADP-ribose deacetylase (regulator of RNase III)